MPEPIPLSALTGLSASSLQFATASELRTLELLLSRTSPGAFAQTVSEGKWKMARHLAFLDRAITESIELAKAGHRDGLLVSMPPQHGKSELCSKYLPAWYLGNHPDSRVILTSYEADFAASWGRKSRDLLEQHGDIFGVKVSKRSSAVNRWDLAGRDGGMTTAGVGGAITGKGAHLLIVDDPLKNDEEARSSKHREKQWQWWQAVATTRLRPGGLIVVVQTRWNRDDLTGRIQDQAKTNGQRWLTVKLPALAELNDPLGRAPGEALWPEVYSKELHEKNRATRTNYYWRALYQQDPVAEGGTEWPDTFFGPEVWFNEWPTQWKCRAAPLDPSKGTDAKFGDYSAFVMLLVGTDGVLYVDADLAIRNTSVIVETALEIQRRFQPDGFAVETNQFQFMLADEINRRGQETGIYPSIFGVNHQTNKLLRIRRLTSYLARGLIRFKGGSAGAQLLVEQLRDFPLADHDDGPDALEMAISMASALLNGVGQPPVDEDYQQVWIA
jgi:predicted phage terminase large subunit-like protein